MYTRECLEKEIETYFRLKGKEKVKKNIFQGLKNQNKKSVDKQVEEIKQCDEDYISQIDTVFEKIVSNVMRNVFLSLENQGDENQNKKNIYELQISLDRCTFLA